MKNYFFAGCLFLALSAMLQAKNVSVVHHVVAELPSLVADDVVQASDVLFRALQCTFAQPISSEAAFASKDVIALELSEKIKKLVVLATRESLHKEIKKAIKIVRNDVGLNLLIEIVLQKINGKWVVARAVVYGPDEEAAALANCVAAIIDQRPGEFTLPNSPLRDVFLAGCVVGVGLGWWNDAHQPHLQKATDWMFADKALKPIEYDPNTIKGKFLLGKDVRNCFVEVFDPACSVAENIPDFRSAGSSSEFSLIVPLSFLVKVWQMAGQVFGRNSDGSEALIGDGHGWGSLRRSEQFRRCDFSRDWPCMDRFERLPIKWFVRDAELLESPWQKFKRSLGQDKVSMLVFDDLPRKTRFSSRYWGRDGDAFDPFGWTDSFRSGATKEEVVRFFTDKSSHSEFADSQASWIDLHGQLSSKIT